MATKKTTPADASAVATTPPAPDGAGAAAPATVTLASPYGWYGDDGEATWYSPGQVVDAPGEVADLMARKAPLVGIDHDFTPAAE